MKLSKIPSLEVMLYKIAIKNLLGAKLRTWLNVFVTSISFFMIIFLGNFKVGLLSMIPNYLPILIGMGFMSVMEMPLDFSSILIGSIAIGLAVDDTIHFLHNYQRYFDHTGDIIYSVKTTLETSGRAMFFTTVVLSTSFMVYGFSMLKNLMDFGLITAFTIAIAFFADLILSPALVSLISRKALKTKSS